MKTMILAFGMPGPVEIGLILFVILLLFGAQRLPDLARSMGRSLSEFKRGKQEGLDGMKDDQEKVESKSDTSDAS